MTYPAVGAWDEYVASLAPSEALRPNARALLLALMEPWEGIDRGLQDLAAATIDPADQVGGLLDYIGRRQGIARGGLGDSEYARILAGWRVVRQPGAGYARLLRAWLAVTGAAPDAARMFRPGASVPSVWLAAVIAEVPSPTYLVRVGEVVRQALPAATESYAVIGVGDTMIWGATPWGDGTWGYLVPVGV